MAKAERIAAYEALMKFYPFTLDDLDGEQWRPISGYEGLYQISNFGRVKSFKQGKVIILKPNFFNGYLRIKLLKSGERMYFQIGKSYKNAGGESREKIDTRISDSVRKEIRKLYKKGVRGCGCKCLARKFGCDSKTILKIVKEVD